MSRQAHPIKTPIFPMEGESRIRTKSVHLTRPNGSKGSEDPEIYLWAGSSSLFVSADMRDLGLEDLRIRVRGTRLIFFGTLHSGSQPERNKNRRAKKTSTTFFHTLDLPYEVNVDEAEVQNEDGLISIVLKRRESRQQNEHAAQSSFRASMQRFFGENGKPPHDLKDEITMLETFERYLDYHLGKGVAR